MFISSVTSHDERAVIQVGVALHAPEMGAIAGGHSLAAILAEGEDLSSSGVGTFFWWDAVDSRATGRNICEQSVVRHQGGVDEGRSRGFRWTQE